MLRLNRIAAIILCTTPIFSKYISSESSKTSKNNLSFATEPQQSFRLSSNQQKFIETLQYRANNPIQDRVCYRKLQSVNGFLVAVFDGHGGDLTSEYANNNIGFFLQNRLKENAPFAKNEEQLCYKSLVQAFDDVQITFKALFERNLEKKKFQRVGACALAAIVMKQNVYVANAGDCQGILLNSRKPFKSDPKVQNNREFYVKTNKRLNAGQPEQKARLKSQFPNQPDIYKCIQNTNYCYVKGRLQPTRSLADYYLKQPQYNFTNLKTFTGPYISHRPLLTSFDFAMGGYNYLMLATDGLWDQLNDQEVHQVASKHTASNDQGQRLSHQYFIAAMQKIKQRNKMNYEELLKIDNRRDLHDDISYILVDLQSLAASLN